MRASAAFRTVKLRGNSSGRAPPRRSESVKLRGTPADARRRSESVKLRGNSLGRVPPRRSESVKLRGKSSGRAAGARRRGVPNPSS